MSESDAVILPPALDQSKLYALARREALLEFLVPDLRVQIGVEVELDEIFPRTEDDKDHTRILINYTTLKGKSQLYKFLDTERLSRKFDIDDFMNGFVTKVVGNENMDDSVESINTAITSALNVSVTTVMDLNTDQSASKNTKLVSEIVLSSLTSILFNDALDVLIALVERPLQENQTLPECVIGGLWAVKYRPIDDEVETQQ